MLERSCRALTRDVVIDGVGLHSGGAARVRIEPRAAGWSINGRALSLELARPAARRSVLAEGDWRVETPEHLLAALAALGIVGAALRIDGGELPALDGSALPFVDALLAASELAASGPARAFRIVAPLVREHDGARCAIAPADAATLTVRCRIDFAHPRIGAQQRTFTLCDAETFARDIAPARTFGLLADADALRARGLARGASHDNTLVFDDDGPMSALRFDDEPVRHKILDVIGDCALLGAPLSGEVSVERAGHALLCETLREAMARGAIC